MVRTEESISRPHRIAVLDGLHATAATGSPAPRREWRVGEFMRFAGYVIWFVLGGWYTALFWLVGAAVFAVSIVGLPLTIAALQMARLSAWPFGKDVVHIRDLDGRGLSATTAVTGTIGFIVNVLWACTFGILLFVSYVIAGILSCLTIIGIPFGLPAFKLAGISLWPVGRRVVDIELAHMVREGMYCAVHAAGAGQ
jgi:uncharacterized membrane protein YccF (DUF307 family)